MKLKRICVFCGSANGARPIYREVGLAAGTLLAKRGIGVVYGGGNIGLMGAVADAAMAAGGEVIGVIPEALMAREVAHQNLSALHVVKSMHERKALMADLSDAFLALPGGFGTFDEFCEVLTWSQLGIHKKTCALLNVEGYYDPLLAMFDQAMREGFLRPANRSLVIDHAELAALLDMIERHEPRAGEVWIDRGTR